MEQDKTSPELAVMLAKEMIDAMEHLEQTLYPNAVFLNPMETAKAEVAVTDDMREAGIQAYFEEAYDLMEPPALVSGLVAAYRAMHAVAPVDLVSEGERIAVKERDAALDAVIASEQRMQRMINYYDDVLRERDVARDALARVTIERDKLLVVYKAQCERYAKLQVQYVGQGRKPPQAAPGPAHDFTKPRSDDPWRMGTWKG